MSLLTDITGFIGSNASIISAFEATPVGGTNMFISFEPDSPDNCITVYPYGGAPPNWQSKQYLSSVQVRVRMSEFDKCYDTAQSIIDQMHANGDVLTNSNGVPFAIQSQPIYLTRDDELRSICVCNFDIKHVKY